MRYEERALILSCLVLGVLMLAMPAMAAVTHSVGVARDTSNGTIAYVEHHQYLPSGRHLVSYYLSDGTVIATKEMTYPGLPQHPEIDQQDLLRDEQITLSITDQTLNVRKRTPRGTNEFTLTVDDETIVDAGFDAFIRSHWAHFADGTEQQYKFAVAGEPRLLTVLITKEPGATHAFTIKPKNFLVRLFVSDIQLRYDTQQRLQSYQGLTNLKVDARNVLIQFSHYTTAAPLTRPLAQWLPDSAAFQPGLGDPYS
ncbi:MAG: hypothetical protein RJQ07_03295 [Pseudomonadales bacterium]